MSDSGSTPFKFFEGFLQHKGKDYQNYTDLWLVLKDSVIYIFTDSTVGKDTHIGKLTIDRYTEVYKRGGDDKSGYKFELFTGYGQTRKKNKFKSSKKVYMEMWRGYLAGLAVGTVPNDLDLLPDQVSQIQSDIDYFRNRPKSNPSVRSGNARNRMSAADSGINVDGASMTTRSSGKTLGGGSDGGPTTRHKFTNDHNYISDQTPSWFFENCSRQQAETILTIGKEFGNTLMRMSSTHKDHGSYVISKMFEKENRFEHFEVLRVANGYKINVENQHHAMSNLTEVMDFFIKTAGKHDTFPMKSNRLSNYGLKEEPDYATKFYNTQPDTPRESVIFNMVSSEPEEPLPDYEEPVPRPVKTFTPGILKKEGSKYYHRQGSTGEAGSTQVNHVPYSTVSHGNRHRSHQRTSVPPQQDFEKRVVTAAHLQHLDNVIDQFEPPAKEEEYVNKDFFNQARTGHFVHQPSRQQESQTPPLPPPHTSTTHKYTNEDNRSVLSMPLPPPPDPVQAPEPPPPPPPPAPPVPPINNDDSRVKNLRSKSVPNVADQINQMKLRPARTDLTKQVTGDLPGSVLRESQRVKNPSAQNHAPIRPKSFASFDNIPKTPLKLKQVSSPNLEGMSSPPVTDTTPEIDESALSPVGDIRKKFEVRRKSQPALTTAKSPGTKTGFNYNKEPVTTNQGSRTSTHFNSTTNQQNIMPSPASNTGSGDEYYNEDSYYSGVDQGLLMPEDDGEMYDDTEGPEDLSGHVTDVLSGKTTQNVTFDIESSVASNAIPPQRNRLMSAPAVPSFQATNGDDGSDEDYEDTGLARGTRRSFKQKLENMLAGNPPPMVKQNSLGHISSNTGSQASPQIPPIPSRSSRGQLPPTPTIQEQLYEELPPNSIPEDDTNE